MTKAQKLTTEEARKQFAELLNGSQFRSEHTEITRHGKAAGYLVPPEWYEAQHAGQEELKTLRAEVKALRRQLTEAPAAEADQPAPEPRERPSPPTAREPDPVAALTDQQAAELATRAFSAADREHYSALVAGTKDGDRAVVAIALDRGVLTASDLRAI
jgi:hypothetical protein